MPKNSPIMLALCFMLALYFMLSSPYYAENIAGTINTGLLESFSNSALTIEMLW